MKEVFEGLPSASFRAGRYSRDIWEKVWLRRNQVKAPESLSGELFPPGEHR